MGCCSGSTQTRRFSVILSFRPTTTVNYRHRLELNGRNGVWRGRATADYDFGSTPKGGNKPIGTQSLSIKMELNCTEADSLILAGQLTIQFMRTTSFFELPPIILRCPSGGPECWAEWPMIFMGEYLGNVTIRLKGKAVG